MDFTEKESEVYGSIRADLERKGTSIGANAMLIAAVALENDLTVVTHNTGEFSRIPGLKLTDWTN